MTAWRDTPGSCERCAERHRENNQLRHENEELTEDRTTFLWFLDELAADNARTGKTIRDKRDELRKADR